MNRLSIIAFLIFLGSGSCNSQYTLSDEIPEIEKNRDAKVLSAFFGLDNDLPKTTIRLSPKAPGKDGMPVVFSQEIDPTTLETTDFRIRTAKDEYFDVDVVTLRPAIEAFELRTVLLIGDFGDYPNNEPVEVEIIGELLTRSGQSYKGQKVNVTPLEKGPDLSYAEYFELDDNYPYVSEGRGCDCPKDKTEVVVRIVWSGGVRATNGNELGDNELKNFTITLANENDTLQVTPFKIADLNDNDNNIDLCIKEKGIPLKVSVIENTAIDPRNDANEFTETKIISRW